MKFWHVLAAVFSMLAALDFFGPVFFDLGFCSAVSIFMLPCSPLLPIPLWP